MKLVALVKDPDQRSSLPHRRRTSHRTAATLFATRLLSSLGYLPVAVNGRRLLVGGLGVAVVILGLRFWVLNRGSEKLAQAEAPSAGSAPMDPQRRSGVTDDRSSAVAPAAAVVERPAGGRRVAKADVERLRSAIRTALLQAQSARSPVGNSRPEAVDGAVKREPATLDREYIRDAVKNIEPLIQECFALGRARDPELQAARVVVQFSIVGNEKLGGVVDESKIDEASSEGTNPLLLQCVRETMYSLELPAPRGQGRVEVTYPFSFDASKERGPEGPGN